MSKKRLDYSKGILHKRSKFRELALKETPLVYTTPQKKAKKPLELTLLSNIQFIYELALARLELHALGADFQVVNNMRTFKVFNKVDEELLRHRLAYFERVGDKETEYYHLQKYNLTRSVNQYLTHWIYPYKGKYHPQMIRALLNIIGIKPGETVLDPFIGSGTTAVECEVMGINCIGIDVSPLCVLISKVKSESVYVLDEVLQYANNIKPSKNGNQENIFGGKKIEEIKDERVKNFYVIAEMIAHSDNSRRGRDFESSFYENIQKMITSARDFRKAKQDMGLVLGKVRIEQGDARKLKLEDESTDGIITSPPYSIALNYVENDAHSLRALGYDLNNIKEDFIGVRGNGLQKFELYYKDMHKSISEMYRVLKKGKYCVIVVGNVTFQNKEVDTAERTIRFCQDMGFSLRKKIEKIIYGLYNIMQKEYILIFKK